jgi:hypothetical protein
MSRAEYYSIGQDLEPFVVVLSRRLHRARKRLKMRPDDQWSRNVIAEAHDYLHFRTIQVPWLPQPIKKCKTRSNASTTSQCIC